MKISKCRSCGEDIIWAMTPNNKQVPLNAKPVTAYCFVDQPDTGDDNGVPKTMTRQVYLSHFGTCPQAKKWSKKNGT